MESFQPLLHPRLFILIHPRVQKVGLGGFLKGFQMDVFRDKETVLGMGFVEGRGAQERVLGV
jgi:hypothetical protein